MIQVDVDITNPGQFFGCCGLFELSERLWPGVEGRFGDGRFELSEGDLGELAEATVNAPLTRLDESDATASPLWLGAPFDLRLDWWKDTLAGGAAIKTWAGRMDVYRIASAMLGRISECVESGLFGAGDVVFGQDGKKVEPFYFDARRGATARPLDLGFSPDALDLSTVAFPAVEFLALTGLQRFRPCPQEQRSRLFRYRAWNSALPISIAALAAAGAIDASGSLLLFENRFRTDQRKHKAFSPAVFQ